MTAPLGHEHAHDALAIAALGALPAEEHAVVATHAAQCASCGPELAAFRAIAARLDEPDARPALAPARAAAVRERLVARARGGSTAPATAWPRAARWFALAASGAAVAAGLEVLRLRADRDMTAAVAAQRGAVLAEHAAALAALTGPDVRVVELASARSAAPIGRMFWDRRSHTWVFYAHRLPPARAGRTYQLWLVTPAAKISAGTFNSSRTGKATVRARYEMAANELTAVAVTDEPAGGVAAATGELVLAGEIPAGTK